MVKKDSTKNKVILFNTETNEVVIERVVESQSNMVESESGVYNIESAQTFIDTKQGALCYVFDAPILAKVEAENLKLLRRNVALKQIFKFERGTGQIDWFKWLPYIIIMMMVLFNK